MIKFLLGKKIAMSQVFNEEGKVAPITLIKAGPCFVTQVKTKDKDGYEALQLGFERIEKEKKIKKSQKDRPFRYLREVRISEQGTGNNEQKTGKREQKVKKGDKIDISVFHEGDRVKISGISKGKGFQGAVKRHGFAGRGASHGVKHEARTLGSVGSMFPQRVVKGRKMPGRMGAERVTVKNLEVVKVDLGHNILAVKGAVPGRRGTLLEIRG